MKKSFIILLLVTLLASCQEKELEIKLLNSEVISKSFAIDEMEKFYTYPIFNNETEKYVFTSIIKFEISNPTDKKYLLFIKDLNLSDIYNLDIIIEDEKGNLLEKNEPLIDPSYNCKLGSLIEQDFYNQNEKEILLKKMGYNIKSEFLNFYNQDFIIYPNGKFIFQTSLSLPFIVEDNEENLRRPIFFRFNPKEKYTFYLKYKLKDDIEKLLSKDILLNYKANNIEIYKGEIKTQKIPIVFK